MLTLTPRKNNVFLVPYKEPIETIELDGKGTLGNSITAIGETTSSGLFLVKDMEVKTKNTTTAEGVVVSLGPDVEGLEVGWRVIYNVHSGRPFEFEKTEYIKINDVEIFGIVTKSV